MALRWWWCRLLVLVSLVLVYDVCLAEPAPPTGGYGASRASSKPPKPASRPHVQTNLRTSSSSWTSSTPSPAYLGNKSPLHLYGQYRRTPSVVSSGYGSRSPSLSPSPQHVRPPTSALLFSNNNKNNNNKNNNNKKPPCDCDCYSKPHKVLCAAEVGSGDRMTLLNECHLECAICTSNKRYKIVGHKACESLP